MVDHIARSEAGKAAECEAAVGAVDARRLIPPSGFEVYLARERLAMIARLSVALIVALVVMLVSVLVFTRTHPWRLDTMLRERTEWKIDLRTADQATLQLLPGIGPTIAGRIVIVREAGDIKTVDDLRKVTGIGPKTLEKIRPFLIDTDNAGGKAGIRSDHANTVAGGGDESGAED